MPTSQPLLLLSREFTEVITATLEGIGETHVVGINATSEAMRDGTVYVSAGYDPVNAELIERFPPETGLIARIGNGVDNIDLKAAAEKGIAVSNTPVAANIRQFLSTGSPLDIC